MSQAALQQPTRRRKVSKATVTSAASKADTQIVDPPAKRAAKRSSLMKMTGHASASQPVAKVVRGAEALQLLMDAGILTASGNVRRRFK